MTTLSYEQLQVMKTLEHTRIPMDAIALASSVECSWDEMYELADTGLINLLVTPDYSSASRTETGSKRLREEDA